MTVVRLSELLLQDGLPAVASQQSFSFASPPSITRSSAASFGFGSASRPVTCCFLLSGCIAVVTVAALLVWLAWTTAGVSSAGSSPQWRVSPSAPLSPCPPPTFLHLRPPLVHQQGEQERCLQLGVAPAPPAASSAYPAFVQPVHTFLITFPRSGNTMIRKILEDSTGVLTGSVYGDVLLLKAGLRGEMNVSRVLLLKHHFLDFEQRLLLTTDIYDAANSSSPPSAPFAIERFIYGLRNPMDSLVSYFVLGSTASHDGTLLSIDLDVVMRHLMSWLPAWAAHVQFFTSDLLRDAGRCRGCRSIVVQYEDFIDSRGVDRLRSRLLCFLGYPLSRGCAPAGGGSGNATMTYKLKTRRSILNSSRSIPRNMSYASEIFSVLKPEQIAAIDRIAGQQMRRFGYWPFEHSSSSSNTSRAAPATAVAGK